MSKKSIDLEKKVFSKLQPAIDDIMKKFMGVRIQELGSDISGKVENPLLGFEAAKLMHLPLRKARKLFREEYLKHLLLQKYGNVSEVARIAGVERRTVHRLLKQSSIDVDKIRDEMLKPQYVKEQAVGKVIGEVIEEYRRVLHPEKIQQMYVNLADISRDIVKELPKDPPSLKDAEKEFEKAYFKALQFECKSMKEIARKAGMRYETVHRKMKDIGNTI